VCDHFHGRHTIPIHMDVSCLRFYGDQIEYVVRLVAYYPRVWYFVKQPLNIIDLVAIVWFLCPCLPQAFKQVPFYIELAIMLVGAVQFALLPCLICGRQFVAEKGVDARIVRILRLGRVFRLFKLGRYSKALRVCSSFAYAHGEIAMPFSTRPPLPPSPSLDNTWK